MTVQVEAHLCSIQTEFQKIDIYDTIAFGKILFLDGHVQLASLDEFAYHESLVQVPLLNTIEPKSALVVGGGDGGVLRELCKNPSLTHIDMVEIDVAVIEASRKYMPELSAGAFEDPRVSLHIGDAFEFLKAPKRTYDLIVMDSTDVYEEEDGGLSDQLFTTTFYQDCRNALSQRGFVVTQADNLLFCPYSLKEIQRTFASVFPVTGSYWGLVPSFGGMSGYCWASLGATVTPAMPATTQSFRYLNPMTYSLGQNPLPF